MAEPDQSFIVNVPRNFNARAREILADEIILFIRRRTQRGLDKNNRSFPAYSQSYKDSIEFTATNKSDRPNLTLTDDMLSSMVLKASGVGFIRIGMSDEFANDKASWNKQNGRDFLGISGPDLAVLVDNVRSALGIRRSFFGF